MSDGDYVCQSCLSEYYTECSECGEFYADDEMYYVHDSQGREIQVCEDCRDKYYTPCACCHEYYGASCAEGVCILKEAARRLALREVKVSG